MQPDVPSIERGLFGHGGSPLGRIIEERERILRGARSAVRAAGHGLDGVEAELARIRDAEAEVEHRIGMLWSRIRALAASGDASPALSEKALRAARPLRAVRALETATTETAGPAAGGAPVGPPGPARDLDVLMAALLAEVAHARRRVEEMPARVREAVEPLIGRIGEVEGALSGLLDRDPSPEPGGRGSGRRRRSSRSG